MYFRCVLWVALFILGTSADGEVNDLVKKIQNMQSRLNYLKTRQSQGIFHTSFNDPFPPRTVTPVRPTRESAKKGMRA